jgi:hypothetical protein
LVVRHGAQLLEVQERDPYPSPQFPQGEEAMPLAPAPIGDGIRVLAEGDGPLLASMTP